MDINAITAYATSLNIDIEQKASFVKIGKNKKAIYVPKRKKGAKTVDVSGFNIYHPAMIALKKRNGAVVGQIDAGKRSAGECLRMALELIADDSFKGFKAS